MAVWLSLGTSLPAREFQVNTYTANEQVSPVSAVSGAGDFVVVWQSLGSSGSDTSGYSIQARRYSSNGTPIDGQFQVNTYTTYNQKHPAVAIGSAGDFVVVWQSEGGSGTDTSLYSIQARLYSSNGTPMGSQFQVNTYYTSFQRHAAVAMDSAGEFIIVWQSEGGSGTDTSSSSIQAQLYASSGTPMGGQLQVNSYTSGRQEEIAVAMNSDGDFVVVWQSFGSSGTDPFYSIQAQLFASSGVAIGDQFQANSYTTGRQRLPAVASDSDGDFVIVWQSEGSGDTDTNLSIQAQLYASSGMQIGNQFQVNSYTTFFQTRPTVASSSNGAFVVAWESGGSSGTDRSYTSIQARRYASSGAPIGTELQVNSYTTGHQTSPAVASNSDGDFVVAWESNGSSGTDSSEWSIQAWLEHILSDGFESGDTRAWSFAIP